MPETTLTFIGTAAVLPETGRDTACFAINRRILFDCGWHAALEMRRYGLDAADLTTLFFTHCHHDHYMGLPALLFYRAMRAREPLTIVGPPDDLPLVLERSREFLQAERFPSVWPALSVDTLAAGATYEGKGWRVETVRALHPVTGICGRFTDLQTGAVVAFSGDTGPNPALAELACGADLLIHEASIRADVPDESLRGDHSRAIDAARTATEAGVKRLLLLHLREEHRETSLAAARAVFPETGLAEEGLTLSLP